MTEKKGVVSVGAVSLFLILTVLLLVTFSLLALTVARKDADLSARASQTTAAYYAADAAAWDKVERAAALLERGAADDGALEALGIDVVLEADGAARLSFEMPVSDVLTLESEVRLRFAGGAVTDSETLRWRCAPAQD